MTGKGAQKEDENGGGYLHRGIARRSLSGALASLTT